MNLIEEKQHSKVIDKSQDLQDSDYEATQSQTAQSKFEKNGFQSMLFLTPPKVDQYSAPSPLFEMNEGISKINFEDFDQVNEERVLNIMKLIDGTP